MSDTETKVVTTNPRNFKRWLLFAGIFLVVIVAAIVGLLILHKPSIDQKVYAQADGHKIYKKDIEAIKGSRKDITNHDAATVLADKYLSEAMVRQQDIKINQNDILAAYGSSINSQKTADPYGYQNLVNQLYFSDLNKLAVGTYEGQVLVANFSRYVPYQSALLAQQKAESPNIGNSVAIASDKKYAQDFITNLYNQIHSGRMTFDQAIQAEHNDPVVGESAYGTQLHSDSFNGPIGQIGLLSAKSIRSKVTSMKAGELSAPFVVKVSNSDTNPKSTAEMYFLVIRMNKITNKNGGMTFDQELAKAKKQLSYEINI